MAHLTSAHPAFDTRVFHKQANTLASVGYEVWVVAPHDRREDRDGVHIEPVPMRGGRVVRLLFTPLVVVRRALRLSAAVYHLHDPELIPVGLFLKLRGKRVVYDAHENLGQQLATKAWLPQWLRKPVAMLGTKLEQVGVFFFDAVVAATPGIARNFPVDKTTVVFNFPKLEEFSSSRPLAEREVRIAYVGGVTATRGSSEMVESTELLPAEVGARLTIAGPLDSDPETQRLLDSSDHVDYQGILDRQGVSELLASARLGLVVLHPIPSYVDSYPVKLFEYMAAGLPVVASDFPLWRAIIEASACGVLVDPLRPSEIASAMEGLLRDPQRAEEMGRNGRAAARDRYNWHTESEKLVALYAELVSG